MKIFSQSLIIALILVFTTMSLRAQLSDKPTISVLGEVTLPGNYELSDNVRTINDVLALAGDLTVYGMRTKIVVKRVGDNGKFVNAKLNLDDKDIISSPYFYLKPDDIIYVTPNKAKTRTNSFGRKSTIWVTLASTFISMAGLLIQKLKL